jgi:hypothetical protein
MIQDTYDSLMASSRRYAEASEVPEIHPHTRNLCAALARWYREDAESLRTLGHYDTIPSPQNNHL